jgi:hypothetical protein
VDGSLNIVGVGFVSNRRDLRYRASSDLELAKKKSKKEFSR